MKKKLLKISGIVSLILFFGSTTFGQTESFIKDGFKITQTIKIIDNIKVVVSQNKSLTNTDPLCTANIKIFKNDKRIDSLNISDDQFNAVGERYGLLIYDKLIKNHVVITKFGSYNGQTIIINNKGQKFITLGGFSYLDKENGLLFSIYHSDLSGFSVFDLNTDIEIFKTTDMKGFPQDFFKTNKDKYFCRTINDCTNKEGLWEIDFEHKIIRQVDMDLKLIEKNKLEKLIDYKDIIINCE